MKNGFKNRCVIIIFSFLSLIIIFSGCSIYQKKIYNVVLVGEKNPWTQNHKNSCVFACGEYIINIDFIILYEFGDHIFLESAKENPFLFNVSLFCKHNVYNVPEESLSLSDEAISLFRNSETIKLIKYRQDISQELYKGNDEEGYRKYVQKSYNYEYELPEHDPENNMYRLTFDNNTVLFDSENVKLYTCVVPPLHFRIIRKKEFWISIPGHSGPLF